MFQWHSLCIVYLGAFILVAILETLQQSPEPGAQVSGFLAIFKVSKNVHPLLHYMYLAQAPNNFTELLSSVKWKELLQTTNQ